MRKLYTTSILLFFFGLFSSWNSFGQTVSISNTQAVEGTNAVFTVSLSNPSSQPTTIDISTANGTAISLADYITIAPVLITIPAGQTSMTVTVPTVDDLLSCEPTETFTLNGTVTSGNTTNTTVSGICSILDNDGIPTVVINDVTVTEGTNATFTIMLSNPCALDTFINLTTANGTAITPGDYTALTTTVTIPAGSISINITVPTVDDIIDEPNETFTINGIVTSGNTSNSAPSGIATIMDNDIAPVLTINNVTVTEGQNAIFLIQLSNPSSFPTTINVFTVNGTAIAPGDYTALTTTVTIPAGATSINVTVPTIADVLTVTEPTETFTLEGVVTSTNTSNTTVSGTGTILEQPSQSGINAVSETIQFNCTGAASGSIVSVIANDTLNGVPVTLGANGNVTLTNNMSISSGITIDSLTGVVSIPPNMPAGSLPISYTICEIANPNNCDTVTSNLIISPCVIDAVSDTFQAQSGGTTTSVLTNDSLNGNPVLLNQVTMTSINLPSGFTLNSNGTISISPNVTVGNYVISYQICEIVNPNNCDTATVIITVSSSNTTDTDGDGNPNATDPNPTVPVANADFMSAPIGVATTMNILVNDDFLPNNGNIITMAGGTAGGVVDFNSATGLMSYSPLASEAGSTVTVIYQVCHLNVCSIATVSISITSNLGVTLTGTYSDYNNDGFTNVGDVINYQVTVSNSGSQPITNITYAQGNATISGGPIASLAGGTTDATTFTGVYVLTQNDINSGVVSIDACFYADNSISQCGTTTTTLNLSNGIRLNAFLDSNSNGIQNSGEPNISSGNFNYTINGGAINNVISSNGVLYLYESNPTTVYNLSYVISGNYSCSTTYSNVTVAAGSGITTYNFPVTVVPFTDLSVQVYPWNSPMPGFYYTTQIYFRNNGNQTIASGTITYTKDNALTITSVSPSATTATATGFTYNFTNLLPNESRTIFVGHSVPTIPTVSLGQMVTSSVVASIPVGDVNISNNTSSFSQPIVGSYDPNDKSESHGGKILHSTFTSNDYLTYTINFENTGTAEAINIRVNDILDAKLDETSIKMVTASSGYTLQRVDSTLTWKFDGINLPPSNGSATVGHGQIVFQIKPKAGYAVGDIIPNTANIYFDFNPAIVTNVCNTQFVSSLSNSNFTFNDFKVYPNPTKNNLTISNEFAIDEVEICSVLGQKMITKKVNDLQTTIDTSELSNGIYFVKVSSQGNEKTVKIVKE